MNKRRRKFRREFRVEAVKLVTLQGYSFSQAAESLGIGENRLQRWEKQIEGAGEKSVKWIFEKTDGQLGIPQEVCISIVPSNGNDSITPSYPWAFIPTHIFIWRNFRNIKQVGFW